MASATPAATPEVIDTETFASAFACEVLTITVGDDNKAFKVHHDKLAKTSFFEKETLKQEETRSDDGLFVAEGNDSLKPDFHVKDRFFATPAAFDIFVKFLYNEPPSMPTTSAQLTTIQQAYGLALRYDLYTLQNKIMDCIRSYHAKTHVTLEELKWTCRRFGDSTECRLVAYLVDQIAYEMVAADYREFVTRNPFTTRFWVEDRRVIREDLVKAILNAKRDLTTDPSIGRQKYHVHERGPNAGQPK